MGKTTSSVEKKLKRAVIKEELVALTGDYLAAVVLSQFLYWSERTRDFDRFIQEERERDPNMSMELTHGWIYKSADELHEEIMVTVSPSTVRRRTQDLVKNGWLNERRNPKRKWDRTLQYRPDIWKIQTGLAGLGYVLEGYPLQIEKCILHDAESKPHDDESNPHDAEAIPEITTEIIPETTNLPASGEKQPELKESPIIPLPPAQTETPENLLQQKQAKREEHIRLQETHGTDPLEGMFLAHVRGASDESSWTTPSSAGGLDPFTDGPLTAWCDLVGRNKERLPPKRAASCARELRYIAEQHGANAEQLTWALRQWRRAVIAYAFRKKGEPVFIPGNIEWQKPTWNTLWANKNKPDECLSERLASLIQYGMNHGLADLDLTKDPTVAAAPERRGEPPERMED